MSRIRKLSMTKKEFAVGMCRKRYTTAKVGDIRRPTTKEGEAFGIGRSVRVDRKTWDGDFFRISFTKL